MITGSINLTALRHVKMEKKGKSGMVKGIFIPLEVNKIKEHEKGGIYLNVVGFEMKEVKDYATHIVKQSFSKDEREKMSKEELDALPILGNFKASDGGQGQAVDNSASTTTFDADSEDDLPF